VNNNIALGGDGDNVDGKSPGPTGGAAYGGGIYVGAQLTMTNATIAGNSAKGGQGGPGEDDQGLNILAGGKGGSAFGGGVYSDSGGFIISDSTISGNSSKAGGGAA